MYTTGTNCNHEFIVIMTKDEFNMMLMHIRDDAFHEGLNESTRINKEYDNDDF